MNVLIGYGSFPPHTSEDISILRCILTKNQTGYGTCRNTFNKEHFSLTYSYKNEVKIC
jgi:hypothetical protein